MRRINPVLLLDILYASILDLHHIPLHELVADGIEWGLTLRLALQA
jgi:hypothetical protein